MALTVNMFTRTFLADHYAPPSEWDELYYALTKSPQLNSENLTVILNDEGEYSGWTYNDIASFIAGGGVWIDWCGWPLAITDTAAIYDYLPGLSDVGDFPANFGHLTKALGCPMGYKEGDPSFSAVPAGFPYVRSLVVSGSSRCNGFMVNPNTPTMQYGNDYCYSSFAIRYQKGAYIYAFGNNDNYGAGVLSASKANPGVSFAKYWPFIEKVMSDLIGYKLTTTGGPSYTQYGTYVGETPQGYFIYERQQNGQTIQTLVDINGTVISHGVIVVGKNGSSSSGGISNTSVGSSACGNTNAHGYYVGTGDQYGSNARYTVYEAQATDGYYLTVLDPADGCKVVGRYFHQTATKTPATKAGAGTNKANTIAKATDTSTSAQSTNTTLLWVGGGLLAAGAAWYLWKGSGRG